jgi:RHS repeat-associated protein
LAALVSCAAVFAASLLVVNQGTASTIAGTLSEVAQVDANGAANFSIPIPTPPGIGGMQPDLTLTYSSQQSNGMVGVGWSIGLPSIERTKRIRAIDGVNGTIAYDQNDRFALQGRRLIVSSGQYGADGSTYHTEVESWQLVTAHGQTGSGPQSFTVKTKDGRTLQLGATADSRAPAAGGSDVRQWGVSSITDLNGNSMSVRYSDNPLLPPGTGTSDHQLYPVEIAYTANASQPSNRSVRFAYKARPDVERTFVGGSPITLSARLTNIQTYVGTSLVSDFQLAYTAGTATGRSRLTTVTRSANGATVAMAPATFGYSDNPPGFGGKQSWLPNAFSKAGGWDGTTSPFTLADVNGDGFVDIVGFKNGTQVALGRQSGFQAPTTWIDDFSATKGWTAGNLRSVADVDGDGLGDVVGFSNAGVVTALSNGASFIKKPSVFPYFGSTQGWTSAMPVMLQDVNGDSIMDIVGLRNGIASVALGQAGGDFATPTTWLQGFGLTGDSALVADFNGDGNADLLRVDSSRAARVALSTGTSFDAGAWQNAGFTGYCGTPSFNPKTPLMIADVNGDGLADVVAFCDAVYVTLSNGKGFQPAEKWNTRFAGSEWSVGNQRMLADLNGDGAADLVGVTSKGVIAALSTGSAFADGSWNDSSLPWGLDGGGSTSITTRLMADANADGRMDMVGIGDTSVYVGLVAGAMPDLMTSATRSAGGRYAATYAPLSDPAVYSESRQTATAARPALAQFQSFPPLPAANAAIPTYRSAARLGGFYYVVKSLVASDNPAVGPTTAYSYSYEMTYQNGKVDLNGRGWMGFATVTTNSGKAKQEVRTYLQDFPFTGQLAATRVNDRAAPFCGSAPRASAVETNDYGQVPTPGAGTAAGSYVFVFKTAMSRQLFQDCAAAHRVRTTYAYDPFGNEKLVSSLNRVDANGNPFDPSHNLYVLTEYHNDTQLWVLGYPLFRKVSAAANAANIGTFADGIDVSLTAWTYDAAMDVASKGEWDNGNHAFLTDRYTSRDAFGNLLTTVKPSGAVYTSTYDTTYRTYAVSRTVSPGAGAQLNWKYGYDPRFGLQAVVTDPNGVTDHTCYDGFGRVSAVQSSYPDNRAIGTFDASCVSSLAVGAPAAAKVVTVRQMSYVTVAGLPALSTTYLYAWPDGGGRRTFTSEQYFDGLWRKSKLVGLDPGAKPLVLNQIGYTARGKVAQSALPHYADAAAQLATVQYDVLQRPLLTSTPFGLPGTTTSSQQSTTYIATADGGRSTTVQANGTSYAQIRELTYGYAANKLRLTAMSVQGAGGASSYTWDIASRPQSIVAPAGQDGTRPTYSQAYDSLGRTLQRSEPTRGTITFGYDTAGNLKQRRQAGGSSTYSYDLIGRRTGAVDSDGRSRTYTYDRVSAFGLGRLATSSVLAAPNVVESSRTYGYDANGNTSSETLALASPKLSYQTGTAFDPQARSIRIENPDGSVVQRSYGGARLAAVTLDGRAGAKFADYAPGGVPRNIAYQNGITEKWTFNVDGSPYAVSVEAPSGTPLLSRQYTWDQLNRLAAIGDAASGAVKTLRSFGYTGLRLTNANDAAGGPWSYAYDDAGNLTKLNGDSYNYSGTKALTASGDGGFSALYNSMGDMTALVPAHGNAFDYTYDARDQLVTATKRGEHVGSSYLYDAGGERIAAAMPDGTTTVYVSPWYLDVRSGGGAAPTRVLSAFGRSFAQWGAGDGGTYLHADQQRSVLLTTDSGGNARSRLAYSPTGTLQTNAAASLPRFLFTGKELDPYTGMYWLGYRSYHPLISRFNKPDNRLAAAPDRQDAVNDNAYALNSPASYFDPSGHLSIWVSRSCMVIAVGSGVGGLALPDDTPNWVSRANTAVTIASLGCPVAYWLSDEKAHKPGQQNGGVGRPGGGGGNGGGGNGGGGNGGGGNGGDDDVSNITDAGNRSDINDINDINDIDGPPNINVVVGEGNRRPRAASLGQASGHPDEAALASAASNSSAVNSVEATNLVATTEDASAVSSAALGATTPADTAAAAAAGEVAAAGEADELVLFGLVLLGI